MTNHKVYTKNGIIVEWSAPTKANGILKYYLIQWTIGNQTHSEKINYQSETDRNVFKVSLNFFTPKYFLKWIEFL